MGVSVNISNNTEIRQRAWVFQIRMKLRVYKKEKIKVQGNYGQ